VCYSLCVYVVAHLCVCAFECFGVSVLVRVCLCLHSCTFMCLYALPALLLVCICLCVCWVSVFV